MKLSWYEIEELQKTQQALEEISQGRRKHVALEEMSTRAGLSTGKILKWLRALEELNKITVLNRFGRGVDVKTEENSPITAEALLRAYNFVLLSLDDPLVRQTERLTAEVEKLNLVIRERDCQIAELQRETESLRTTGKTIGERIKESMAIDADQD